MLQAMNTGHDGSLTTVHANNPRDALARTETLVLTAGVDLPLRAIREQISSAFDLIVQVSRLVDGTRRITHVTEVLRMESDVVTLQDIFIAKPVEDVAAQPETGHRLLGPLTCTGIKPHFLDKMAGNGVNLPPNFFLPDTGERPPSAAARVRTGGGSVMRRAIAVATTAVALLAASSASAAGGTLTVKSVNTVEVPDGGGHRADDRVRAAARRSSRSPRTAGRRQRRPRASGERAGRDRPAGRHVAEHGRQKMHDAIDVGQELRRRAAADDIVGVYGFGAKPYTAAPLVQRPEPAGHRDPAAERQRARRHRAVRRRRSWPPTTCRARSPQKKVIVLLTDGAVVSTTTPRRSRRSRPPGQPASSASTRSASPPTGTRRPRCRRSPAPTRRHLGVADVVQPAGGASTRQSPTAWAAPTRSRTRAWRSPARRSTLKVVGSRLHRRRRTARPLPVTWSRATADRAGSRCRPTRPAGWCWR